MSNIDKEYKDLNLFTEIAVEKLCNFKISKSGIIYNKTTNNYLKPHFHKNTQLFTVHLYESHYQLKHLLYITFINNECNFDELRPEEWKQLSSNDDNDEYYKIYEISNHGRFKNRNTKKILKLHNQNDYLHANVNIYNPEKNKKEVKKIRVNILVAKYFLTVSEKYLDKYNLDELVVDHIDKNKENNYFENLQYLSNSENVKRG
jgi:hypothetical protein